MIVVLAPFNDNHATGTTSSYGLLATRDTRARLCVCLWWSYTVYTHVWRITRTRVYV